jgi:predicted helicase
VWLPVGLIDGQFFVASHRLTLPLVQTILLATYLHYTDSRKPMSIQLIQQYHAKVEKIIRYGGSRNEGSLSKAFQDLLEAYASSKNLLLVPQVELRVRGGRRVVPDGTLKDALRQDWGYWESKDEKDDLADEIATKFAKGYPPTNILFEDTHLAVLYQNGAEIARADFTDAPALDAILTRFVNYEPKEVTDFHHAIEQFTADVPALAEELRHIIDEQAAANAKFKAALSEFLELAQKAINPRVELADAREMLIQHILTEDIFMTVFDEPQFHRENAIARKLQEVVATFYHGATQRKIHARIAPYYETINARAAQIYNHHEKQKFLKALYETFYRAYNPKAADRLGIVYTPDEIVRFMIHAADHLTFKHFNKTLGDQGVEILDPVTGTGTFITELIEYLPDAQLPYKYREEIHCNEVAILPYYIANLNIEYTYKQKTGEYVPFENICFVDTLDNQGFVKSGQHQMDFLGMVDENTERIERQNKRKISVIIGNPPYNANQLNENENNKNREYPDTDKRIKETYIKHSTAQKSKVYDMYARFYRWASDRIDENGIVAFVTNSSFLDSRTFDGFRKVVADEFSYIYILDLGGDVHDNPKISGTMHNVFGIQVGVAICFMIKKKPQSGQCHIYYARRPELERASEKLALLRTTQFPEVQFEAIHPDKHHDWLNQATKNDWETFIPLAIKDKGQPTSLQSIFNLFSLGIATNRDEWVYDFDQSNLASKIRFFYRVYSAEHDRWEKSDKKTPVNDFVDRTIKWTSELEAHLAKGTRLTFNSARLRTAMYRPFVKESLYYDRVIVHRTYQQADIFPINRAGENMLIACSGPNSPKPFAVLATNLVPDLNSLSAAADGCRCLPLYRYTADGERVDNITDWALEKFRQHYQDKRITKDDIFHYVYAVLHHPAYREKYALNLKREFPRIPFYADFRQWAKWGKQLMDLHLNYEEAKPFALKREEKKDPKGFENPSGLKPRLMARKEEGVIEVDTLTTLRGVPSDAWDYRLGTYTALEWVLDRHKEKTPKDPTIREKFNTYRFADYKEPVIDLLRRVCTVSVETIKIIRQMPA